MRWRRGECSRNLEDRRSAGADQARIGLPFSMPGGRVQPESFTHGSSEQRIAWFRRGLESGDPARCDSFAAGGP